MVPRGRKFIRPQSVNYSYAAVSLQYVDVRTNLYDECHVHEYIRLNVYEYVRMHVWTNV